MPLVHSGVRIKNAAGGRTSAFLAGAIAASVHGTVFVVQDQSLRSILLQIKGFQSRSSVWSFCQMMYPHAESRSAAPESETRVCRSCLAAHPIDQFRRRSRSTDARMHDCNSCHANAERARRQRKAQEDRYASTVESARFLVKARREREFTRLVANLIRRIGAERIAENFAWAMDRAIERQHVRAQLSLLQAVVRLLSLPEVERYRDRLQHMPPDADVPA